MVSIVWLMPHYTFAQNLVPNASFEDHNTCNIPCCTVENAIGWYSASNSTPDYYHSCSINYAAVPLNFGGFQYAKTGDGYVGLYCYQNPWINARDYVGIKLKNKLSSGTRYYVSYYVSLTEYSQKAVSTMGAYFSADSIVPQNGWMLSATPQIENNVTKELKDTFNWMQVSGSFVAIGTEQYLTIGNFKDDTHCGLMDVPAWQGSEIFAYYIVDDVTVSTNPADCGIDTSSHVGILNIVTSNIGIYPNPLKDEIYLQTSETIPSYAVTDLAGRLVQEGHIVQNQIAIAEICSGVYLLHLWDREKRHIGLKKIVKE